MTLLNSSFEIDGAQSSTACAASVNMSPNIEESDSNEDDGLNRNAARFITWSIDELTPSSCDIDENDPWRDSRFDEMRRPAGSLASMQVF